MADETATANGVASLDAEEQAADNFYDLDQGEKESKLKQKVEELEQEKVSLLKENSEAEEQISKLTAAIESLKSQEAEMRKRLDSMEMEVESSGEIKRMLEMISGRAAELETQVSRLQHDLISAMSDGQEASAEALSLKEVLADKDRKLEELKKEKAETDQRLRELERAVALLEVKETEERSKRVSSEEQMREKIGEKDREIGEYKRRIQELEEIVSITEANVGELKRQAEEAQGVVDGLKDKTVEVINGIKVDTTGKEVFQSGQLPLVAIGSVGVVAAAAGLVYFYCARRK